MTLKLRRYDFTTLTRSQTLPQPTDDPRQIAATARRLLAEAGTQGGLRLLGVGVSGLSVYAQGDLFAERRRAAAGRGDRRGRAADGRARGGAARRSGAGGPGRTSGTRSSAPAGCGAAGWAGSPSASRARCTAPGPVRTLAADDPLLQAAEPPDWRTAPRDRTLVVGLGDDGPGADRRRVRRRRRGALPGLPDRPRPVPASVPPDLPAPRITPPSSLPVSTDARRAGVARLRQGLPGRRPRAGRATCGGAPDAGRAPRATEADVVAVLDWAGSAGVAVVPYGGGSSVVGGVEYRGDGPVASSLDLTALDRVLEVDRVSRAARIQGGALGPALEDQLRPHGLTLRHFPQSFEFSTLGGWLATRAGGHYATLHTHIDDLVESMRVVTPVGSASRGGCRARARARRPTGCSSARRARSASSPRRGCGCRTGRGSRRRPSVRFADMTAAMAAVRAISQAGAVPGELPAARPGRGGARPAPARRAARARARRGVGGTSRWTAGSPSCWTLARDHGGRSTAGATARDRVAPPTPGGRRSCGCPTSATGWPG